jgi:chloramphenicol 3-O phosphotransferase
VIVLNGGSSSGKSSIARELQELLPELWLTVGVDTFIHALPGKGDSPRADITYSPDGGVRTGALFRSHEQGWYHGLVAMVRHGVPVILDEVLLAGAVAQASLRSTLEGLDVCWVGVRCDPSVAERREAQRVDRTMGMARLQAEAVHEGVLYDIEVDTTHLSPKECAEIIAESLA